MKKEKLKEMIVVEGKNDTHALKRFFECDTIETNGSALTEETIEKIRLAVEKRGVIIFTDPDFPGEKVRKQIEQKVSGCMHAFLPKKSAIDEKKKKVGIEHGEKEALLAALKDAHPVIAGEKENEFTLTEMQTLGLVGASNSKELREQMGEELRIGYANGKQFIGRLHQFRISRSEFNRALKKVMEEEIDDK